MGCLGNAGACVRACVCVHTHEMWKRSGDPREGNGGKKRKPAIHLSKSSPQFIFQAVCDVIIGDGIWLRHGNSMLAGPSLGNAPREAEGGVWGALICDQSASSRGDWPC